MTTEDRELRAAKLAVQNILNTAIAAELERNPKKGVKRVLTEITIETLAVEAPYAREYRGILNVLAGHRQVAAVSTPRFGPGEYRRGTDVMLIGLRRAVRDVRETFTALCATIGGGLADATPLPGEDVATYRASWLLGYRLALTGAELAEHEVREAVATVTAPHSIAWKSTGSGSWAGYRAGRGLHDEDQAHDEEEEDVA